MRTEDSLSREIRARPFGRKGIAVAAASRSMLVDDLKLFAMTFLGGFLFVSLYLA